MMAAEKGHLEVLQWALQNDCPWSESIFVCARGGGYTEVIRWLIMYAKANGCPGSGDNVCEGKRVPGE
jgi:hypothetical protein